MYPPKGATSLPLTVSTNEREIVNYVEQNCYDHTCQREHYTVDQGRYVWRLHTEDDLNERETTMATTFEYDIMVSTGTEVGEPGRYVLYATRQEVVDNEVVYASTFAVWYEDLLPLTIGDDGELELTDADVRLAIDLLGVDADWDIDASGLRDSYGYYRADDGYGGYSVATTSVSSL